VKFHLLVLEVEGDVGDLGHGEGEVDLLGDGKGAHGVDVEQDELPEILPGVSGPPAVPSTFPNALCALETNTPPSSQLAVGAFRPITPKSSSACCSCSVALFRISPR
jgi:hypothetical protein